MAIRVTQQYVDVFGTETGNLRVSRQYIEVLHKAGAAVPLEETVNQAISFVSTATAYTLDQSVSQDVAISDAAVVAKSQEVVASSSLVFVDAVVKVVPLTVNHSLGLVQFNSKFNAVDDRKVGESTLAFVQVVTSSGSRDAVSDLNLSHTTVVRGPIAAAALTSMALSDVTRSINKYVYASDTLSLTSFGRKPIELTVSQALGIFQGAQMERVDDVLVFVDAASAGRGYWTTSVLSFTEVIIQHGTFRRTIAEDLGIGHAMTYFDDSPCNRKNYAPFQGESTVPGAATAPASSIPAPQADTSASNPCDPQRLLLYWPARGARAMEVALRAPEFGNRDRSAYTRVSRESRGGQVVVYADPEWPRIRTLAVTVVGITKTEVNALQALFNAYLGQLIGLTDWQGNEWEGVVTDPNQPAVHDSKRGWTITFEFEGSMIEGHSPGNALGVTQGTDTGKDPGANTDLGLDQDLGGAMPTPGRDQSITFQDTASAVVV